MRDCLEVIRNRRSVRVYQSEQITEEELQVILDAGRWAPSAHNSQPWHFTVVQNKDLLDHISAVSIKAMAISPVEWVAKMGKVGRHIFHQAPTVIVVSGKQEEFLNPLVDCSAAIQNMLLAAETLDIGSCWIGLAAFFFNQPEEVARLKLPEGYQPFYAVTLGYKGMPNGNGLPRTEGTVSYLR